LVALALLPLSAQAADAKTWTAGDVEIAGGWVWTTLDRGVAGIDPHRNRLVIPAVPTIWHPIALAAADGALWVAAVEDGDGPTRVLRVDARTALVTASTQMPGAAIALEATRAGAWVVLEYPGTVRPGRVARLHPRTARVLSTLEPRVQAIRLAAGEGSLWATTRKGVTRLGAGGGPAARVPAPNGPFAIAVGQGAIWVTSQAPGTLMRVEPRSGRTEAVIATPGNPVDVTVGREAILVALASVLNQPQQIGAVVRIARLSNRVVARVPLSGAPSAVIEGLGGLWVARPGVPAISRIDPATNRVVASMRLP
jgi:streptogramin lyase